MSTVPPSGPAPVRPGTVLLVALVVGALAYVGLRWWVDAGHPFPHPSLLELAALLLIGATCLVLGRRVRRMARGLDGATVTPLTAARTLVLAQASAVTGGALTGAHAASALVLVPAATATGGWGGVARSALLAVVCAALAAVGLVVQGWCRRPPSDPSDPQEPVADVRP